MSAPPKGKRPGGQAGALRKAASIGSEAGGDDSTKPVQRKPLWAAQRAWAAAHPVQKWAHAATRSAIRRGLLTPQPCEECGAEPADAHHADHERPLAVRWLCRRHHRRLHAAKRRAGT